MTEARIVSLGRVCTKQLVSMNMENLILVARSHSSEKCRQPNYQLYSKYALLLAILLHL